MKKGIYYTKVNKDILTTMRAPGKGYYLLMALFSCMILIGAGCWTYQIYYGLGAAGINHPVGWGTYITTFVFWVGIAHSGTLISAVLFLLRVKWRTSIFRSAEAMTIFAVLTAGLFPLIHIGRPWYFYWLIPYPNQRQIWVNFQSPLIWDVFAVNTYLTVSLLFFYMGLIPDIAAARDHVNDWRRHLYRVLSLGWKGLDFQWYHYHTAYLLFAGLVTPLVISVHSVVSWDFAMANIPGWHSTIFAPYFVAGAIFSGLALVTLLLVPVRKVFKLEEYITEIHFDSLGKIVLTTSLIISYAYVIEVFMAWYSGSIFEQEVFLYRAKGDYAFLFWLMVTGNCIVPLLYIFKSLRTNTISIIFVSIGIVVGMWLERFIIIVTSLSHDFDPYSFGTYRPTLIEAGILIGSFGFFFFLFFLFIKLFPAVSIEEIKEQLPAPIRIYSEKRL